MTFYDIFFFAKLFSRISNSNMTMTNSEMEASAKTLKEFGGKAPNWSPMQRKLYKAMVDAAKKGFRGQENGQLG